MMNTKTLTFSSQFTVGQQVCFVDSSLGVVWGIVVMIMPYKDAPDSVGIRYLNNKYTVKDSSLVFATSEEIEQIKESSK